MKQSFKMTSDERKNLSRLRLRAQRYAIAAEEALLSQDSKTAQVLLVKQNETLNEYSRLCLKYAEWIRGGMNATYAK